MLVKINDCLWINLDEVIYFHKFEDDAIIHLRNTQRLTLKNREAKLIQDYLLAEHEANTKYSYMEYEI